MSFNHHFNPYNPYAVLMPPPKPTSYDTDHTTGYISIMRSAADTSPLLVQSTKSMKDNPTIPPVVVEQIAPLDHHKTVLDNSVPTTFVSDNLVADKIVPSTPEKIPVLLSVDLVSDKTPVTVANVFSDLNIPVAVQVLTAPPAITHYLGATDTKLPPVDPRRT